MKTKNTNYRIFRSFASLIMLLAVLISTGTSSYAQQVSGTHVTSYNFSQSSTVYTSIAPGNLTNLSTILAGAVFNFTFPTGIPFPILYNGKLYPTGSTALNAVTSGYIYISNTAFPGTTTTPLTNTNVLFNMVDGGMFAAWGGAGVTGPTTSPTFAGIETQGAAPNRKLVFEIQNSRRALATADSWTYQIVLYEASVGSLNPGRIDYIYGTMVNAGAATTRQVGLRGNFTCSPAQTAGVQDVQLRQSSATVGSWASSNLGSFDAANPSPTLNTMILSSVSPGLTSPASGLMYSYTPCASPPVYATVPYLQDFEATWINSGCGSGINNGLFGQDVPSNNWRSGPLMGNISWRRHDAQATAFWSNTGSGVLPTPFPGGGSTGVARFHTYGGSSNANSFGVMDLFLNLSGGCYVADFDYVNTSGTDNLKVRLSTDGGLTFPTLVTTIVSNPGWTHYTLNLSGTTSTSVIRFEATSDWGVTDIGLDNVSITVNASPPAPACASVFSPVDGATAQCRNITLTWNAVAGASSYDVYLGSPVEVFVQNQVGTSYTPPVLAGSTTYSWKIVPKTCTAPAVGCLPISFTTGTQICYCPSTATSAADEDIWNVTLGSLNNSSDCFSPVLPPPSVLNMYSDFTTTVAAPNLDRTSSYPLSVNGTTCGGNFGIQTAVYIDYNQNGLFTDLGEQVFLSAGFLTAPQTFSPGNIVIPLGATLGLTRMRVQLYESFSVPANGCSNFTWGEVEDYMVNITPAPPCGTPVPSLSSAGATSASFSWPAIVGALTYNYEVRTSGGCGSGASGLVASGSVGTNSVTVPGLTAATAYTFCVIANCAGGPSLYASISFFTACANCPGGATIEGETCGGDINGGCNMPVPAFTNITLPASVCGISFSTSALRDTDWYLFTVATAGTYTMTLTSADFPAVIGFINQPCPQPALFLINTTTAPCGNTAISAVLNPGTYVAFVAPSVFSDAYNCASGRNNYHFTLALTGPPPPGAFCATALPISCGQTVSGNNTIGSVAHTPCIDYSHGVWYQITMPEGVMIANTCPQTGPFCNQTQLGAVTSFPGAPNCASTVCAYDPYCCNVQWDGICVSEALSEIAACSGCYAPVYCNQAQGGPVTFWPSAPTCASTICAYDPYCCNTAWDGICASEALAETAACSGCYAPNFDTRLALVSGTCAQIAGAGPFCDQAQPGPVTNWPAAPSCASTVCAYDPYCCATAWDGICASEALTETAACSGCYAANAVGATCLAENDDFCSLQSQVTSPVLAPGTYYIVVGNFGILDFGPYTLNVTCNLCTSPGVGGTASGPAAAPCANVPVNFTLAGYSGTIQWQMSSVSAAGPYTNIGGATAANATFSFPSAGTFYVRASVSGGSNCLPRFSNVLTYTITLVAAPIGITATPNPLCRHETLTLASPSCTTPTSYGLTTPAPYFLTPSGSATSVSLTDDSQISIPLPSGFSFGFYGNVYTSFTIGSNGWVGFGGFQTNTFGGGFTIPTDDLVDNMVAFAWQDLNPGTGGTIQYEFLGVAPNRKAVITFTGVPHFSGGGTVTSQVVLFECSGDIDINTISMTTNGSPHTMGIESAPGGVMSAVAVPGRNASGAWSVTVPETQHFSSGGGGSFSSYSWSGPVGYVAAGANPAPITDFQDVQAGVYTVSGLNANGCVSTNSVAVTLKPAPEPYAQADPQEVCDGALLQLYGDNFAVGQALGNSYSWTGPDNYGPVAGQTPTTNPAYPAGTGDYIVTVTNSFGCTESASASVLVNPNPTLTVASVTNAICQGDMNGCIDIDASLAAGPYLYNLQVIPPPLPNNSGVFCGLGQGTYTVDVVDQNGCESTINATVIEEDLIVPTINCPPTVTVNSNVGVCYATGVNLGTPIAFDNCLSPPGTLGNGINSISNNAPAQYPVGGTYVQWDAFDISANKGSCQQLVTVVDNEPPVALCKNICIYLGSNGLATITGADINNNSTDNCGIDPGPNGLVASPNSFSYADAGPNTVTLTVKDVNGNTSTCTATVTVGEYYTLFGAGPTCSTPTGQPDACHVHIGNGNNVSGNVGSYRSITTGGGVVINGNVISGGKVNYANGVASKSVSAANLLGLPGLIFQTGNSANITGDVNVTGNININQNGGSFVTGVVRHPVGTTYAGPLPGGGVLLAPAVIPALPGMPTINSYSCGGANITTSATLIPGSYGNITLGNPAGVVITFSGPGNYYFSRISMGQGGIHTFKFDFLNAASGRINIYVCGDIDFGTFMTQWANPSTPNACRVYFETHGTGSTNGTNSVQAAIIGLGSQFYGRIWAPYGGIKIGSGSCCTQATGSFWSAKQVQLEGAVTINRCGSTCPPGPRIGQDGSTAEDMKDMLQVYPNPTTGQTTVSFFTEVPDNYSLKVMDYQGRVVLSNQIKSIAGDNTLEIDMSQFAKGLYLIEVGNQDHSQKVKLVVE